MDSTSWSQESGWLRLESLAARVGDDVMLSLGAWLLVLRNSLYPLTGWIYSFSAQLSVRPWRVPGGVRVWRVGGSGGAEGEESFVATLRAYLPCPPRIVDSLSYWKPNSVIFRLSLWLTPADLRKVIQLTAAALDAVGGRESRKKNIFLSTKVCFH